MIKKHRHLYLLISLCLLFLLLLPACGNEARDRSDEASAPSGETASETEATTAETTETETTPADVTTEEPTTTTEEPTEPPDPRLDVLTHYSEVFVVTGVNTFLNVRNEPSQNGLIIGKLVKDAGGSVLENLGNGWYKIASGGLEGYIAGEYVTTGPEAESLAVELAQEMIQVTADRLNVRSEPSLESEVWTQLTGNTVIPIEEELEDWYKISFNSSYGYVSKEFTEKAYYLQEAVNWSSIANYSPARQQLFAYAQQFIGIPYAWGGTSLSGGGIDCSSYVQQCFRNALGIGLPRTSYQQVNRGTPVSLNDAKAGDLMFYTNSKGTVDHVAIYMGDGKILHAALSFGQVTVSAYNYAGEPAAIRNVIGE